MSIDDLRSALLALDEPAFCEGSVQLSERLAIVLPDGDLATADWPRFVEWLVEHGEPAPFGQDGETRLDPAVRSAIRLAARGAARVGGFDPACVLGAIEDALSPRTHLVATLTDVLVYPPGGHFARHKDTPRRRLRSSGWSTAGPGTSRRGDRRWTPVGSVRGGCQRALPGAPAKARRHWMSRYGSSVNLSGSVPAAVARWTAFYGRRCQDTLQPAARPTCIGIGRPSSVSAQGSR